MSANYSDAYYATPSTVAPYCFAILTRQELREKGFSFDGALPQPFFDKLIDASGKNPCGRVVYLYSDANKFGAPLAIDVDGAYILAQYARAVALNVWPFARQTETATVEG